MTFCPHNLQSLANECKYATNPSRSIDQQIANAIDWVDIPPFTSSLDAVKILIELTGDYSHYGVLKKKDGLHSAFLTVDPETIKTPRLWSATDVATEVLSLCAVALFYLADKHKVVSPDDHPIVVISAN